MHRLQVNELTCNHLSQPIGLDSTPFFGWKLQSSVRGEHQSAYRIGVASSKAKAEAQDYDMWDTGVVKCSNTMQRSYEGATLSPRTRYYVAVTAYDSQGEASEAAISFFETGMMGEIWQAKWISKTFDRTDESAERSPYLRKVFALKGKVASARLYACGLGYFEAFINGERVSDEQLWTPFTRYDARALYRTFDVTSLLQQKDNAIGVIVGNGWYNCLVQDVWNTLQATWKHFSKFIGQIHVTYEDGSTEVIASDDSWKSSEGPIQKANIRNGVIYDARLEMPGWNTVAFDDSAWEDAKIVRAPGGRLLAAEIQPIRITKEMPALRKWQDPEGHWCFDFGQNFAGICRTTLRGKQGTTIKQRYAESLKEDKLTLDVLRMGGFVRSGEFQTDTYIKGTDEPEVFQPSFMYHGFAYMMIEGLEEEPALSDVTGLVMHTDFGERGEFGCDSEIINTIQRMSWWSTISNFYSLPTDCPHREKNAWTGDASTSSEQVMINFFPFAGYQKWMNDIIDAQKNNGCIPCVVPSTGWGYNGINGPDWSSAMHMIPWVQYLYAADKRMLEKMLEPMRLHVDYDRQMAKDYIINYGLGDWCAPFDGPALFVNMSKFKCPTTVSDTAFFYFSAWTVAEAAKVVGNDELAKEYGELAATIKAAFRKTFYDEKTFTVTGNCQTSTALFMCIGLSEPGEEAGLMKKLEEQILAENGHLDFGLIGGKYVPEMLGRMGRQDLMVTMLEKRDYPSFGKWIDEGATTLWECWNSDGSHNHHMFTPVSAFMYKYLAGICIDEKTPGFGHFFLRPGTQSGLGSAWAKYNSIRGEIAICWRKEGEKVLLEVTVPVNTTATLELAGKMTVSENGKALEGTFDGDKTAVKLVSGTYTLVAA